MTVAKQPGHRGEHEISRKTIACGNVGRFRCTRCYSCAFYHYKCTRGRGCSGHPAFPTPSRGREINARLGRIAPRDRGCMFGFPVIASEAKQSILSLCREMDCFASLAMTVSWPTSCLKFESES